MSEALVMPCRREVPDRRGWWARLMGRGDHVETEWFFVETFDDGTSPSVWMNEIADFVPVAKFSRPLARWAGPIMFEGE